ncbi:MAG: hypothetical protein LBO77_01765 [Desulfovibrio sp.]|jgi:hypothetical protein|nr:hypothetical protein [Desulfovibrio sp.]
MKSTTKKILGISAAALAVLAAGVFFFGLPQWEKQRADRVRAVLEKAGLQSETVKYSLLRDTITLTGLSGTLNMGAFLDLPNLPPLGDYTFRFKVGSASLPGFNFSAKQQKGTVPVADSLTVTDFSFEADMPGFDIEQTGSAREILIRKPRLDVSALLEQIEAKASLTQLFAVLNSFHAERVAYLDYSTKTKTSGPYPLAMSLSIARLEGKDVGLLRSGPFNMEELKVLTQDGDTDNYNEVFSLRRCGFASFSSPDVYTPILRQLPASPNEIMEILRQTPLVLKDFAFQGMTVTTPVGAVTLDSLGVDLVFSPDAFKLAIVLKDLAVPAALVLSDNGLFPIMPISRDEPFLFSLNLDGSLDRAEVSANLGTSFSLEEKSLGGITLAGDFTYPLGKAANAMEALRDATDSDEVLREFKLRSLALSLKDYGLLDLYFSSFYEMLSSAHLLDRDSTPDVAALRREVSQEIFRDLSESFPNSPDLPKAAQDLLQRSGSLTITLTAKPPASFISVLKHPENIPGLPGVSLQVEHTPAAK